MEAVINALENLERLIYRILIWIILIPKTLLQVVLYPDWAPGYIDNELGEGKSRFDEYLSPVVLLLLVALLPFIAWNFMPIPGIDITSPVTSEPTTDRTVDFNADIKFISSSTSGYVTTFWRMEEEVYDNSSDEYYYPVLKQDRYTSNPAESNGPDYFNYRQKDNHTIQDFDTFDFPGPGRYWVVVTASKFDKNGAQIENYESDIYISVPDNQDENVVVSSRSKPGQANRFSFEEAAKQLKSEQTIFLALGLLLPPLLFAMVTKLFGRIALSEDNLKATFYVQCYYFSPVAFIFWATRYGIRFFTPEVFFHFDTDLNLIILLPLTLAVFWFISVQTHRLIEEVKINGWFALGIVLICMVVLLIGGLTVAFGNDPDTQDIARKLSIWLYPLLSVGLITAYHVLVAFRGRRRFEEASTASNDVTQTGEQTTAASDASTVNSTGDKVLAGGIVFIMVVTVLVVLANKAANVNSKQFDLEQRSNLSTSTAIFATLQSQQNSYIANFSDASLQDWSSPFITLGDVDQAEVVAENNNLIFHLNGSNGQATKAYLINFANNYSDVQVDVVVKNNDVSVISLICRANDKGFYEFTISNSGEYSFNAFDLDTWEYTTLISRTLSELNTGKSENTYTAICSGQELALRVNDTLVDSLVDTQFNYTNGLIGIGLSSPAGTDTKVDFTSFTASIPSPASVPPIMSTALPGRVNNTNASEQPAEEAPTEAPAQQYFTEEFDQDPQWDYFLTSGDANKATVSFDNSRMTFDLEDLDIYAYYLYDQFVYDDVSLSIRAENRGRNNNNVSLVCRKSDLGWYEFSTEGGGVWYLYRVTYDGNGEAVYDAFGDGGAASLNQGQAVNEYGMTCQGNEITLSINGQELRKIVDSTFTSGQVGFNISSLNVTPIIVDVDWFKISLP